MKTVSKEKTIDHTDKRILELIRSKYTYHEIGQMLYISRGSVKHRMEMMREYYGCDSNRVLIVKLTEEGIIY